MVHMPFCNTEARLFLRGSRAPGSWPLLPEHNAKGSCFVCKSRVPRTGPVEGKAMVYERAIKIKCSPSQSRVGHPTLCSADLCTGEPGDLFIHGLLQQMFLFV